MEWSYSAYQWIDFVVSTFLIIITSVSVYAIFRCSKNGEKFVLERIIGIEPYKAKNKDHSRVQRIVMQTMHFLFWLVSAGPLSISVLLLFQGCFLANARLYPNEDCPDYPMDCFVSTETDRVRFYCDPSSKVEFPSNITGSIAWCYGFIIELQTTKNILDQLGMCSGLIGLFTTLLAIIVFLSGSKIGFVLSGTILLICAIALCVSPIFDWSWAALTFMVLILGVLLGAFGLTLSYIIFKQETKNNNGQILAPDKPRALSDSNIPLPKLRLPTATALFRVKTWQKSSQISPQPGGEDENELETIQSF